MYISEAVKKAVKKNRLITRKKFLNRNNVKITTIKPTNSLDMCIFVSYDKDTKKTRMCRAWNSTQDDLVASDWELLSKKLADKISNSYKYMFPLYILFNLGIRFKERV